MFQIGDITQARVKCCRLKMIGGVKCVERILRGECSFESGGKDRYRCEDVFRKVLRQYGGRSDGKKR